jgi:hypothetical protein
MCVGVKGGGAVPDSNNDIHALLRRLDGVERNHTLLSSSYTNMIDELDDMRKLVDELRLDRAARVERDKRLDDRFMEVYKGLERLETSIKGMYKLGWWVLAAFGSSAVALFTNFALGGGFIAP